MNLMYYFILFMIYSIIGWIVEVFYCLYTDHKLVNRGFLVGPYCPIYGSGCLLIIILLDSTKHDFLGLFLKSIIICSILEYSTSYIMEKFFKARWWDYSDKKFNINGRICLETMLPFGILACLVVYFVNPFFSNILLSIDVGYLKIISICLLTILLIDFIISFKVVINIRKKLGKITKDNTEEITKKIKKIMESSKIFHRLINAFPILKLDIFKSRKIKK